MMSGTRTERILASGLALAISACALAPRSAEPVFHLCASNVAAVRADPDETSEIEVQLRSDGRRAFELFAKRHYGQPIHLVAGDTVVGEIKVLFGFRTGRLTFDAEDGRVREVFEALDPPPVAPCGEDRLEAGLGIDDLYGPRWQRGQPLAGRVD
ncbi:MAG: hypothetical protein NXI30_16950 [bacterium]|nr:hypothetical protein [bacterium]